MKISKTVTKIAITAGLIALAVGWRIINHNLAVAPNLELVTTASVLAAIILGIRAAIAVPLATVILSDLIIGNSSIFMFTWTSFVLIGLMATLLRKLNQRAKAQIAHSFGFAIASSFLFFVITNFGVWSQGWYPMTTAGLVQCFVNAIPFYRTMLIGNMLLVPAGVSAYQFVRVRLAAKNLVVDTLVR